MTAKNIHQESTDNHNNNDLETENLELTTEATEQPDLVPEEGNADTESIEDELKGQLQAALFKAEENLELAQRTQAEMENLRKRLARDIENAHKYALERLVTELLPVIDSFELGIQAAEGVSDSDSLKEGMNLTLKKLLDVLEKSGVTVVDPLGDKFNPDQHDAVSMADSEEHEPGTVMSVLQKGYELNGRLVRPAMVVVTK